MGNPVNQVPANAAPVVQPDKPSPAAVQSPPSRSQFPDRPQPVLAGIALAGALLIMLGTGIWYLAEKTTPGYTGGGAAAATGILFVLALILYAPALTMDDSPEQGGEPSTMRILSLAIVLTFCAVMLRTGWNGGALPSLENQGNWVWLVTAALGGKALQKFAEVQDKNNSAGSSSKKQ